MSSAFSILSSDAAGTAQNRLGKMAQYGRVRQGVEAFNTANEQSNYIKDALGTGEHLAKDLAIEGGSIGIKKLAGVVTSKIGSGLDALRGTKGGAEALGNRIKQRFTNKLRDRNGIPKKPVERDAVEEDAGAEVDGAASTDATSATTASTSESAAAETADATAGATTDAAADAASAAADAAASAGGDAAVSLTADAAEVGGDVLLSGALDLLDATGVGAIIGVPLQIATLGGLAYGGVETAIDLTHDLSNMFGSGHTAGDIAAPPVPKFISNVIAPTMES
jgi:hypothetical protein